MAKRSTIFLGVICIVIPTIVAAQPSEIRQIDRQAHAIKAHLIDLADLEFLSEELRDKTLVGLGEASHGTHEFYVQKARIVRYLIRNLNYRSIGFEVPGYFMDSINYYVQGQSGDLNKIMQNLALYNAREIQELFQWVADYNAGQSASERVKIWGFDSEEYWYDQLTRDKRMADNIIARVNEEAENTVIWGHNVHLAKDTTMARFEAVGSYLKSAFGSQYYVMFFDTYEGAVSVLDGHDWRTHSFEAPANSLSASLAKSKYKRLFISFSGKENPWHGMRRLITNIYSTWTETRALPVKPGVDFDGLIFFRKTSAAMRIE